MTSTPQERDAWFYEVKSSTRRGWLPVIQYGDKPVPNGRSGPRTFFTDPVKLKPEERKLDLFKLSAIYGYGKALEEQARGERFAAQAKECAHLFYKSPRLFAAVLNAMAAEGLQYEKDVSEAFMDEVDRSTLLEFEAAIKRWTDEIPA